MRKIIILMLGLLTFGCQKDIVPVKSRSATVTLTDVNIGTTANDGTGDAIRTAFGKVNSNNALIEAAIASVPTDAEMRDAVNDSINDLKEKASALSSLTFLRADSNSYGGAMTYNGVVNYVAANGGTGGGGYKYTSFIVGTTTGAPANADTAFTVADMAGNVIELYRGTTTDLHKQWLNETATNGKTGYRYNSSGQIVVRPAWATNDRAFIKGVASSAVSKITLSGGASTLLTSLRAGWQLNETSGTQVNDVLSNYTGSTTGTVNQAGKFGVAETFVRASAQWANMGQSVQDVGTSDFAMAAWFNISTSPGATAGIAGCVYDSPYYYMGINSEDHAYAIINFGSGNIVLEGSVALSASTWYHMVLNVDRSGNATLHVDGSLVDTEDVSAGVAVNFINNNSFAIGAIGNLSGYSWNGSIDEVFIWTKVLSGDEIATLQTKTYPWN